MVELKTLKEMDRYSFRDSQNNPKSEECDYILQEDLKQEAIKWIKELKNYTDLKGFCMECLKEDEDSCRENHEEKVLVCSDPYEPEGPEQVIRFIKHFFNISEEDLK